MNTDHASLKSHLAQFGQQHLLAFWDQLDEQARAALAEQVCAIDFGQIEAALQAKAAGEDWAVLAARSTPPPAIRLAAGDDSVRQGARLSGEQALRDGKVGAILVAGGQGSRLGFDHPKGMYPIGPVSNRTLFELHVDRLLAMGAKFGVQIPLYLMTSPATHKETVAYFEAQGRLGLAAPQLTIFCQGTMPAVDAESGRLILAAPDRLFLSPDGHGGTLAALAEQSCLDRMERDGIEQLYYFQVDNPLAGVADPEFVGHHLLANSELTTQVVAKVDPAEKVGVVVAVDDHLQIVEYSDLPVDLAARRLADGSLEFWAGNIAVHIFERRFLQRMAHEDGGLPWHLARKKVPYLDEQGQLVVPDQPNAIKLETFIFDLLPSAKNALVVEVSAENAFAPLKNASGAAKDTPETCRDAISNRHKRWLRQVGATVADDVLVEIRAGFALDAEELLAKIDRGLQVSDDTYFA